MSLIFEALKKLERDKQGPERGVVVLASAATAPAPRASGARPALALGGAVLLVAIAAGAWWSLRSEAREAPADAPAVAAPVLAAETAPAPIAVTAAPPVRAVARPVPAVATPAPAAAAPAAPPALRLTAIGQRDGHAVAVINDEVLQVGDVVGDARIVEIGTSYVEVERDGVRQRVTF